MLKRPIKKVDRNSILPRYYQVIETIKELIVFSSYKKGDKLPSERNLASLLGVSLITIRRATEELTRQGILTKEWGKGIFVKEIPEKKKKTHTIGLTCWRDDNNYTLHPVSFALMQGAGEMVAGTNYQLQPIFINSSLIKQKNYKEYFASSMIDALINTILEIPDEYLDEIEKIVPVVVHSNRPGKTNTVMNDLETITYDITKLLITMGHKRIGLINGSREFPINLLCVRGYKKALFEHGTGINEDYIKDGNYSCEAGYELTCELLKLKEKPTAIICGDDYMGIGCLNGIRKNGLVCPDDVSVISFGDFPFAKYTHPPLSSIRLNFYEMGRKLAEMAIKMINNEKFDAPVLLKGEIVLRGTIKKRR